MITNRVLAGSKAKEPRPPIRRPKAPTANNSSPAPKPPKKSGQNNNASQGGNRGTGVNSVVNGQIRAGVNDARKERRVVRREAATARRAAVRDYKRSLGDLDYIYGETGDYVKNMGQQIHDQYAQQTTRAEAAQAALVQQLQSNSTDTGQGLSSELSRLGLQGVDNSQFAADAQNAVNVAQQTGANDLSNISAQQTGADAISSLLGGMVAGSRASGYGTAQNTLDTNLYDIYQTKRDGYNQVREAISDLRGTRKDLTAQMLQQLGGGHWGRYLRKHHGSGGSSGGSQGYGGGYTGSSGGGSSSGGTTSTKPTSKNPKGTDINSLLLGGIVRRRK